MDLKDYRLHLAVLCACVHALFTTVQGFDSGRLPRITEHPVSAVVPRHEPVTLSCKADGRPTPTVSWQKDGQRLPGAEGAGAPGAHSHRVLLPGGSLFFLRVEAGDAGVYRCAATNGAGQAVSKDATLEVAVLRHDFRILPAPQLVSAGDTALLQCGPPRGRPEPAVTWRKDGRTVDVQLDRRIRLVDGTNLAIQGARPSDSGRYQCLAQNAAGIRESPEALLQVAVPPHLVGKPQDSTVLAGASVTFQCIVSGDPQPDVLWRRATASNGPSSTASSLNMPLGRVQVLGDRSLRISGVQLSDAGEYICEADNAAGAVTASAVLSVVSEPTLSPAPPRVVRVDPGGAAVLRCGARGEPAPLITWSPGNHTMLLPGQRLHRLSVAADGALTLHNASRADSGRILVCAAVNAAGAAVSRTRVLVLPSDERPPAPPPVVTAGPANQTLPVHSSAALPCQGAGRPPPHISWLKDGRSLNGLLADNPRFHMSDSGTLHIDDLGESDAGEYTCLASSRGGQYSWSASLRVGAEGSAPQRAPEPPTLPGPPSRPRVNGSDHSLTLSWQRHNKIGSSTLLGYQVEMFSRDSGWQTVARLLPMPSFTFTDLSPGTFYSFLVRAQNSHGLSPPSEVVGPVDLSGSGAGSGTRWMEREPEPDWEEDSREVPDVEDAVENTPVVRLSDVVVVSSTSVKVLWEVLDPDRVEGLCIYWFSEASSDDGLQTLTVLQSGPPSLGFLVTGLHCFTLYQFFLVPFNHAGEDHPSNSKQIRTLPDAPSAPPTHLEATLLNVSTALIKWAPPPVGFQNGPLQSYQVVVQGGDPPQVLSNVTLSVDSSMQLLLSNLSLQAAYHVSVAAATSAGRGPFSAPLTLRPSSPSGQLHRRGSDLTADTEAGKGSVTGGELVTETWFMALLGSMVAVMILLFSAILFLHRRHHRQHRVNKGSFLGMYDSRSNGPILTTPLSLKTAEGMPHPLSAPLPPPVCLVPQDAYGSKYRGVVSPSEAEELMLPEYAEANDAQYDGSSSKSYYAEVRNPQPMSTFQVARNECCSDDTKSSDGGAAPYATTTLVGSARTPLASSSTSWRQDNDRSYPCITYSHSDDRVDQQTPGQNSGQYDNFNYGCHPDGSRHDNTHVPLDHRDAVISFQGHTPMSKHAQDGQRTSPANTLGRESRRLKLLRRQLNRPTHSKGLPPSGQSSQLQLLLRSSPSSSCSGSSATPPDVIHRSPALRQEPSDYTSGGRRFHGCGSSSSSTSSSKPSSVAYSGLRGVLVYHSSSRSEPGSLYGQ